MDLKGYGSYFEKAVERYGNPFLILDIKNENYSSKNKEDILDALVLNLRDTIMHIQTQELMNAGDVTMDKLLSKAKHNQPRTDPKCPLFQAICRLPVPAMREVLTEPMMQKLRTWLYSWGRPSLTKREQLREMEMRVRSNNEYIQRSKSDGLAHFRQTSNNVVKDFYGTSRNIDWKKLNKVSIRDLKLFTPMKGSILEGTLICDPFTPMVGCTCLFEDHRGDVTLIAIYNFLPEGVQGEAADTIAKNKIPKGTKLRIAEPFLKIFKNGERGLRIDNPHELDIISTTTALPSKSSTQHELEKHKSEGNALFTKSWFHAAAETYLTALRKDDMTATLLSNRAQASIFIKDYPSAFADAASSLTIRPTNKKTWIRYETALRNLKGGQSSKKEQLRTIFQEASHSFKFMLSNNSSVDDIDIAEVKGRGNDAFKNKDYDKARSFYSEALSACGVTRAMLSNWSLCALRMNAMHDALASSFASLRIFLDGKALYRVAKSLMLMGEPELAIEILDVLSGSVQNSNDEKMEDSLMKFRTRAIQLKDILAGGEFENPMTTFEFPTELCPNWFSRIETFDAGRKKGRGVRATTNIGAYEPVLLERPIAACETRSDNILFTMGTHKLDDSSQGAIKSAIINRSERDGLLCSIVGNLSDGKNAGPVVPFSGLLLNLEMGPLLLPSHHEYIEGQDGQPGYTRLSSEQVDGIIQTNAHGFKDEEYDESDVLRGFQVDLDDVKARSTEQLMPGKSTELFPALSMFNHDSSPNCRWLGASERCVVVTIRPISKGEELTVSYHPDEELVRRNWGI